jgi:Fic family protein
MSRAITKRKAECYNLVLAVTTRHDWEPWILFMVAITEETARWTTGKIRAIRQLLDSTADHVRRHAPKLYTYELIALLFTRTAGSQTSSKLASRSGRPRPST